MQPPTAPGLQARQTRGLPPGAESAVVSRLRAAGCVFAEDEARILISAARNQADLDAMVRRRASGLPLEHVVGWADFCGLRIAVDPGVFVPRRRSEFLVRQAAALVRQASPASPVGQAWDPAPDPAGAADGRRAVIIDLCCGSGAVGAALAAAIGGAELHAVDIEPAAVRCARRNLAAAGGRAYLGDLYRPLPARLRGHVRVLVANAPYVPTAQIGLLPPEARLHEPQVTLDGGADGLGVVRRVIAAARAWLEPGGWLLIEASERQAPLAIAAIGDGGLLPALASSDEFSATVVIGTMPR